MTPQEAYELVVNDPLKFKKKKDYYESIIAKDWHYYYEYAYCVLKGRFELGEKAIATNTYESVIATSSCYSYWYAKDVLKGRFELGEHTISCSKIWIRSYINIIKKDEDKISFYYKII